jgi:hypothetical protein
MNLLWWIVVVTIFIGFVGFADHFGLAMASYDGNAPLQVRNVSNRVREEFPLASGTATI